MKWEHLLLLGLSAYVLYQIYENSFLAPIGSAGHVGTTGNPFDSTTCYDFVGRPYQWPNSAGPCPTS